MPLITTKEASPNVVAAGSTSMFDLPLGLPYHRLILRYKAGATPVDADEATMIADLAEIRLIVNGETKWEVPASFLIARNKFYKRAFRAGALPLYLSQPWARTAAGEDEMAWGTGDMQSFKLEVDIAGTAVNPSLELYALKGPQLTYPGAVNPPLGKHVCLRRFGYQNAATGVMEIADRRQPAGTPPYGCTALHFDTADISDIQIRVNNRTILEGDKTLLEDQYGENRAWQTGFWHVDFVSTNRMGDVLGLAVQDFRIKPNRTSAGAFNLYMERVEGQPGAK